MMVSECLQRKVVSKEEVVGAMYPIEKYLQWENRKFCLDRIEM